MSTYNRCDITGKVIGASHMSAQHGNDIKAHAVHTYHSRIFVLVFDIWGDSTNTDTHRSDEDKGIEVFPTLADISTTDYLCLVLLGKNLTQQQTGDVLAFLTDLNDCYLLHLRISIG